MESKPFFVIRTYEEREEEKEAEVLKEVKRPDPPVEVIKRTEAVKEIKRSDTSMETRRSDGGKEARRRDPSKERRCDSGSKARSRSESGSKVRSRSEDTSRTRNKKAPPPPPPMPNGTEFKQKKGPAPAPPVPSEPPPLPPTDPPSCPTPDYDCLSLASDYHQPCDRVDMQSLESFKLTHPPAGRPKPPDIYFPKNPVETKTSVQVKPLVTVGQYGGDSARPKVSKLDFLGQPPPAPPGDQPLQLRLASELSHTLARSTLKDKQMVNGNGAKMNGHYNHTNGHVNHHTNGHSKNHHSHTNGHLTHTNGHANHTNGHVNHTNGHVNHTNGHVNHNGQVNGHMNGCKGSIIKISVENKDSHTMNGKKPAPFYLFPEGGRRNNTVSFDLTGTEPGRPQNNQHPGILKNSNVSHVQIQSHSDKPVPHKSIKFGPITTVMQDSREPKA